MLRKTLALIVMAAAAVISFAQSADWYKYPVFHDNIHDIVATHDKVYYLSGGTLFSFAPSDNEGFAYNSLNMLNDEDIKSIYYNYDKDYLLIVYKNSNLDVVYSDGTVINMPDIKDASLTVDKTINDVAFGSDRIVVATNFGIVVFSDVRYEVIESGIYNAEINCVAVMNNHILIYGHYGTSFNVMAAPVEGRHNSIDKFTKINSWAMEYLEAVDDEYLVFRSLRDHDLYMRKVNFENYTWTPINLPDKYTRDCGLIKTKTGIYTLSNDMFVKVEPGQVTTSPIPEALVGQPLSFYNGIDKVWSYTNEGISCYDIASGTPTVLFDKVLYQGSITANKIGYMRWSADGKRLYISNFINSRYRSYREDEGSTSYQTTNIIEDGHPRDVSLLNASGDHVYAIRHQENLGNKRMYGDPVWIVEDPDDPDKYYCCSYFEGLYVIKRNATTGEYEEIGKFTEDNSPIVASWGQRVLDVNIDPQGNLWMGYEHGDHYAILPAAKRKADPKTITAADWKSCKKVGALDFSSKDMQALFCKKSNMVFMINGAYEKGFVAVDTKGTYDNPNDDTVYYWSKLTDQDGNVASYAYFTFLLEDNRGCVWVGTNAGIFEITDPSRATDPNMTIRRIKVPRNDGTNYADYLLDSEMINYMALDPAGRKWVATDASGIFLVSETGDKILRNYDYTNSPLPSNTVCAIECDPFSNVVYVGTTVGLYSFLSDASAGKADYSEVYAYPNPVRPEYSGLVTITGLMSNSVVKIADAAGNVVHETTSEGGMATWDATGRDGNRVRSGVYYVYVSEHNSGASNGAVTKILVIN